MLIPMKRLKQKFKDDIEKNNIDIMLEDIAFLDSSNLDETRLSNMIKEHNPTIISLAFCFTDVSELNSILRSAGLYANLLFQKDFANIHEDNVDSGKLIKFDSA